MQVSPDFLYQALIVFGIFAIRVADVSLQTLRIICVSRGIRMLAAVLGFFEILIWLVAITQIMKNINSPVHYLAYASGFAMGNFLGISIEKKLSLGSLMIRVITNKDAKELMFFLSSNNYGVTSLDAKGATGPVQIIFTIIRRNSISKVIEAIKKFNPKAFYTIEEIRFVTDYRSLSLPYIPQRSFFKRFNSFFQKKK